MFYKTITTYYGLNLINRINIYITGFHLPSNTTDNGKEASFY